MDACMYEPPSPSKPQPNDRPTTHHAMAFIGVGAEGAHRGGPSAGGGARGLPARDPQGQGPSSNIHVDVWWVVGVVTHGHHYQTRVGPYSPA